MSRGPWRKQHIRMVPRIVHEVAEVIQFILYHHSVGLLVLTGEAPWPTTQEIYETISALCAGEENERVQGGCELPEAQRMIERAEHIQLTIERVGGTEAFVREFRRLKSESIEEYRILRDCARVKLGRPFRCIDETALRLAENHQMSPSTMRRNRDYIILKIAHEIVFPGVLVWRYVI